MTREWQDGEFWFDEHGCVYIQVNREVGPLRCYGVYLPDTFTPGDDIKPDGKIDLEELAEIIKEYCGRHMSIEE